MLLLAVSLASYSCENQLQEIDIPADITVPSESLSIFTSGLQFTATPADDQNSVTLSFSVTDNWNATIEDTKSSSWLSVKPDSGPAGDVIMTVTVQPNRAEEVRRASVTITCGSKELSFRVTQEGLPPAIKVESVTLDKPSLTMVEGDTAELVATVLPEEAEDKTVSWSTSNEDVATVENGLVVAVKEGTAVITASAGEKSATCEVTVTKKYVPVTDVSLDLTDVALIKGESKVVIATVTPDDATEPEVTWTSSNLQVVAVEQLMPSTHMAKVTAVGGGSAVITAKASDIIATCAVTVSVPVESVSLDKTSASIVEGENAQLIATVHPDDATDKTVTWSTSDATVATVDNGLVTARKEGTAIITVSASDKTATCTIIVAKKVIPVTSVTLNYSEWTLGKGSSLQLLATVYPNNATDKTVTWSSSDSQVAYVDTSGLVTAVGMGTTIITAKAGEQTATCKINVTIPIISLSFCNDNSQIIHVGESTVWQVVIEPEDATDKTVTWSVYSNPEVVSVDQNGMITGLSEGQARIKAAAGSLWTISSIYVSPAIIPVESVTLDHSEWTLGKGSSLQLLATVYPNNATDKTVTWSSSDSQVAYVDASGLVTAVGTGTTIITAKAGGQTATCKINVTIPITSISFSDDNSHSIHVGGSTVWQVVIEPEDATDKTVTWSVYSNPEVASVDQNGRITGIAEGQASIKAAAGSHWTISTISVLPAYIPVERVTLGMSSLDLEIGENTYLTVSVYPSNATNKTVTWSTSNQSVATVVNGVVTAIAEGNAVITAEAGGKTASCSVSVTTPVISLTLSPTYVTMTVGESTTISATVKPDNANQTVRWISTNTSVATVEENGRVTALSEGEVYISAYAGRRVASCRVIVNKNLSTDKPEGFENIEEDW